MKSEITLVGNRYKALKRIGKGAFGDIYSGIFMTIIVKALISILEKMLQ